MTDRAQQYADDLACDMRRAIAELGAVTKNIGLISYTQRKLGIGYNRACLVIDALEDAGILSKSDDEGRLHLR